uniref:Uncharacterized protein n=1 Tax=Utricularia reniformis TaxID=192314 RepID=A0A1Y0B402_9LAMI|nr:hypothetical protein AEK19_MT2026 [Utricularia reniformis]ART32185.1 hypothetical protein AEK19_MT2026 [Utricularia reniformis]
MSLLLELNQTANNSVFPSVYSLWSVGMSLSYVILFHFRS